MLVMKSQFAMPRDVARTRKSVAGPTILSRVVLRTVLNLPATRSDGGRLFFKKPVDHIAGRPLLRERRRRRHCVNPPAESATALLRVEQINSNDIWSGSALSEFNDMLVKSS